LKIESGKLKVEKLGFVEQINQIESGKLKMELL